MYIWLTVNKSSCFHAILYCMLIVRTTLIKDYIVILEVLGELVTGGRGPWVQKIKLCSGILDAWK